MPPIPTKKIVDLLSDKHAPEVRSAAAVVLGEAGNRDGAITRALEDCLDDKTPSVRLQAIRALGKLGVAEALPRLLERIKAGGEESHESSEAVARLGSKGRKALQELMHHVAPGVRRTIAAALALGGGTAAGADSSVAVLLDTDPSVVEGALRSLIDQIPTLNKGRRDALGEHLVQRLSDKKTPLAPVSELAILRVLAALGDARAAPLLWDRISPAARMDVRAMALQALGDWADAPNKDQLKRLLICATDTDFRVAAPALVILKKLPVADKSVGDWLGLLDAPDVTSRRLAMEKVGGCDTKEVAGALMKQLRHPDKELRESALGCLAKLDQGRKALTAALTDAQTADHAWTLARAQVPLAPHYPAGWRENVFEKVCAYLEDDDRRADPLLFLLRETDGRDLRDRVEERALILRKKADYGKAIIYLRWLARDPACGFNTRLELALCGLKASAHDLAAESRAADPCLQQLVRLCQTDEPAVRAALEKSKWLTPEDLYYVGFHLVEQGDLPARCGVEVLKLVAKRSPRSKLGQSAKHKLTNSGKG
jgi:HEAT repeat protein